jgi:hypothetical protein
MDGISIPIKNIISAIRWWGYSGCFLLGPGTLILVISFMIHDPSKDARVYCKDMDWYPGTTSRLDGCKMNIAVDTVCKNDISDKIKLPTISKTIEYWPYATILVMGTAMLNIFIAIIFYSIHYNDIYPRTISYISVVSLLGVFGTSAYGDDMFIYNTHVIVTGVLFITSYIYIVTVSSLRSILNKYIVIILLTVCSVAMLICIISLILYNFIKKDNYTEYVIDQVLATGELLYIFSYSMLVSYVFTTASLELMKTTCSVKHEITPPFKCASGLDDAITPLKLCTDCIFNNHVAKSKQSKYKNPYLRIAPYDQYTEEINQCKDNNSYLRIEYLEGIP